MRNVPEEIVYWYLRLNNFFLIPDFVIHQDYGSDIDFLALQIPGAEERIHEQSLKKDDRLEQQFSHCESNESGPGSGRLRALIVEVKGGRRQSGAEAFNRETLQYTLPYFGVRELNAADVLVQKGSWANSSILVCTMLAKRRDVGWQEVNFPKPGMVFDLEDMLEFIKQRAEPVAEKARKSQTDWHLFPPGLFQYLLLEWWMNFEKNEPGRGL